MSCVTLSSDDHCSQLRLELLLALLLLLLLPLLLLVEEDETVAAATVEDEVKEEEVARPPLATLSPLSPSHSETFRSSFFRSTRALLRVWKADRKKVVWKNLLGTENTNLNHFFCDPEKQIKEISEKLARASK